MLDLDMLDQLKTVFNSLDQTVLLRVGKYSHPDQTQLEEMLQELATLSSFITLENTQITQPIPTVEVLGSAGNPNVIFRGVPGGHEFSSLILAILYANGKGRLPDAGIQARIRSIRAGARIQTYVSLSCENCPGVVQAISAMAMIHGHMTHEVIDGGIAQDEVERLKIKSVPAVFVDGALLHAGRGELIELLAKLEEKIGVSDSSPQTMDHGKFDVVIIGGGPAGVSAAIYSARKGLKTAIVAEKLGGQLQQTKGIENMISIPYTEGALLASQLMEHIARYPIHVLEHRRVCSISGDRIKEIEFENHEKIHAESLIIATGTRWRELGIPGEKEYLGRGVAFCAHCDGPFYRGKRVAVIGGGNSGLEAAIDLAGLASEVTLIEFADQLKGDQVLIHKLKTFPHVSILLGVRTSQVIGDGNQVIAVEYEDRMTGELKRKDLDGVFVQIGLVPNTQFLKDYLELTPSGEIQVDEKGRTSVTHVYAAGDVTPIPFKQIITALGDGAKVALSAFEDRMREIQSG